MLSLWLWIQKLPQQAIFQVLLEDHPAEIFKHASIT